MGLIDAQADQRLRIAEASIQAQRTQQRAMVDQSAHMQSMGLEQQTIAQVNQLEQQGMAMGMRARQQQIMHEAYASQAGRFGGLGLGYGGYGMGGFPGHYGGF